MRIDSAELKQLLAKQVVLVTFTKLDGSTRQMWCTTSPEIIPAEHRPTGKVQLSEETLARTLRVFDTVAQSWRSFRLDSVTEVEWQSAPK